MAVIVPATALCVLLAGCTADAPDTSGNTVVSEPVTTSWTEPEDPTAEGPTEAPALPETIGALGEPIELSTDAVVSIDSITTMHVTPETPGEYEGSAVVVTVSVTNGADAPQSVDSAVVMLHAVDGEVGIATTAGPGEPLRGEVASGERARGTYVFMLTDPTDREVTISVNYAAGEPVAVFNGRIQ